MPENTGTEEYAIEYEKKVLESIKRVEKAGVGIYEYVKALLKGGEKNYPLILKTIKENISLYLSNSELVEIVLLCEIYQGEIERGYKTCIFDVSDDIEEILYVFRQLKYMVIRSKFNKIKDDGKEFGDLITKYKISPYALDKIIEWNSEKRGKDER